MNDQGSDRQVSNASATALRIPPPRPGKPPLKANLFDFVKGANTQLLPMFPYEGPGDIVPCAIARRTAAGEDQGSFLHENSVDEVMVCFGGNGRVRTGEVRVGPRNHGVGGGAPATESFTVNCVTQRQLEAGVQTEAMSFSCEQCSQTVFRHAFSGQPKQGHEARGVHPLPTTEGSAACAAAWNASEATRTCTHCGHLNAPFPTEFWGWDLYMRKTGIAQDALRLLEQAGAGA